jgi:hypothetical protein
MQKKRLYDIWHLLPNLEHTSKYQDSSTGLMIYEVCGRKFQETAPIEIVVECLQKYYDNYGARAKQAADNKGIDWKAISHALRAAYQVRELLKDNTITFPRPEAKTLLKVKQGQMDYLTEAEPLLNEVIAEVEELSRNSTLPDKADGKFWDEWLVDVYKEQLFDDCRRCY